MNYVAAFITCGIICVIGQIIYDNSKFTPGHITSLFVVLGAILDAFGLYDNLIEIGHAGALLPITSFGHSIMHGAMVKTQEFGLLGIPMGMFDLTSAGITSAIFFAFIFAIICKPKS